MQIYLRSRWLLVVILITVILLLLWSSRYTSRLTTSTIVSASLTTATSTLASSPILAIKQTDAALRQQTQDTAPKTPPPESLWTATPATQQSVRAYPCLPIKIAGDGLLFDNCLMPPPPIPRQLQIWGMRNFWIKNTDVDTDLIVISGYGGLAIFPPGTSLVGNAEYYPIIEGVGIEIVDAVGSQLILRPVYPSGTPAPFLYFDVDKRQLISTLNTPTSTPTIILTPTK